MDWHVLSISCYLVKILNHVDTTRVVLLDQGEFVRYV